MNLGIILAAGKGTRFKSSKINKTASEFEGKPLLEYGLDLLTKNCDKVIVVIGAYSDSLKSIIKKYPSAITVSQKKRLGTGHAVKVAIKEVIKKSWKVDNVFVGYGDHMMFYTKEDLEKLKSEVRKADVGLSMITCEHDPKKLAWGRIIRSGNGDVEAIVEEKVATPKQKKIRELNAGFYCLNFDFLKEGIFKIKKNKGGEQYFTDIVEIAESAGKRVIAVKVPFRHVGIGINTKEELKESQKLYRKRSN